MWCVIVPLNQYDDDDDDEPRSQLTDGWLWLHGQLGVALQETSSTNYSVSQKMYTTWCLIVTLANVNQFSKFCHQLICTKILYVYTTNMSTTPAMLLHYLVKVENP